MGKYIFQASAANGIGRKLEYLTEVEHVRQFIIAPPPQVDTVISLNRGSCFTHTSVHVKSSQLSHSSRHVLFSSMVYTLPSVLTWRLTKQVSHVPEAQCGGKRGGDLAPSAPMGAVVY